MATTKRNTGISFPVRHGNSSANADGLPRNNTVQSNPCGDEAVPEEQSNSSNSSNCGDNTEPQYPPVQIPRPREDCCEGSDSQPSWRPPVPIEDGIWVPIHVKTNGEGKTRIRYTDVLVEIFEMRVDLCGKKYGNIHGNVFMDCTVYRTYVFNCDKENALIIDKKGSLPLYGTDVAPLGYDPVELLIDLNIDDDELCRGIIQMNCSRCPYDEWLHKEVKGKNGSVHVTYAVLGDAWLADLELKLMKLEEEATYTEIYGDIIVYINNMQYLRYFVFSKRGGKSSSIIKSLEPICLSRSLFNCPYGSSLVVKVDLWKSDTKEPLVRGSLLFRPEYYGDSVGILGSENVIQVKVNWMSYMKHSKTLEALRGDPPWMDLYPLWNY